MQQDTKQILTIILTIIDYKNDKEAYVNDFIQLCMGEAFLEVVKTLPPERQDEFRQRMLWADEQERQKVIISEYINSDVYTQALQKIAHILSTDFIQALLPSMTDEQKQKVKAYITSINDQFPA